MKTTPTPTPITGSSTTCNPQTHACDTPGGEGLSAVQIFAACAVMLLLLAAVTGRRGSGR